MTMYNCCVRAIEKILETRFNRRLEAVVHPECRPAGFTQMREGWRLLLHRIGPKTHPDIAVLFNAAERWHTGIRKTGGVSRYGWYSNGFTRLIVAPAVIRTLNGATIDTSAGQRHAAMCTSVFEGRGSAVFATKKHKVM